MKNKSGIITVMAGIIVLLIVNQIPVSFADSENQNKTRTVSIIKCGTKGTCFSPCQMTILQGDTVTWVNRDNSLHLVVSGDNQNGAGGWFSSLIIQPHETFSFKFDRSEPFSYFDILHSKAQGVIIVGSALDSPKVHLQQSYFSNWCNR
jgi:plastocyanin